MQQPVNAPASTPIYQSAGWVFRDLDEVDAIYEKRLPGAVYGGSGSPNHWALEAALCAWHAAEAALITSSGMAAFTAALLSLARSGAGIVAARDLYGNTTRLLQEFEKFGVRVSSVDSRNADRVGAALRQGDILIVETISNPRVAVADLPQLAVVASAAQATLVVDNTLASPYHCQPLRLGASAVIESVTKFIGGHHDLVLGCLLGASRLIASARTIAGRAGLTGPAFESWLATRSLAELELRMQRSSTTAQQIASWLAQHPAVNAVHYPGLESHTSHLIARQTLRNGFGSVLSFEVKADRCAVNGFVRSLEHIQLVLSFGGAATTISHPATSSHRALTPQARSELGIHDGFLRLSVGVEPADVIQADLQRALETL